MNQPSAMQKLGATPAKLALVGVLSVILLAVVVPQFLGSSPKPDNHAASVKKKTRKTHPKTTTKPVCKKDEVAKSVLPKHVWPNLSKESIANNDPLEVPDWFVQMGRKIEKDQQIADTNKNMHVLQQLEQQGASILVITTEEKAATIGNQRIKVGDRIEGFRVSDITTEGIVLTEIRSK